MCKGHGPFERAELEALCPASEGALHLKIGEVLHLLQAAGLVRVHAMGFGLLGWEAEREAQQVSGRTDRRNKSLKDDG